MTELAGYAKRELEAMLPSLGHGECVLESDFDGYRPRRGAVPDRARWDDNPLDRKEYLSRVERRVAGQRTVR